MSHLIPLPAPLVAETVHLLVRAHAVRVALPHARARRTRPPENFRKPEALVPPDDMCMRFPSVLCVRGHFMC